MYKVIKSKPDWIVPKSSDAAGAKLFIARMHELDREFARQTKHLTALTKRMGKKIIKF